MAGVGEASAIFGLIAGSIDLIKLSIEIYNAAQGKAPSRIRAVAKELPSIVQLLEDADMNAKAKVTPDGSIWNKVKPDLERCKEECTALHTLFESACPTNDSNPAQRIWKTSVAIIKGKRSEAEEHLAAILKTLSVLETHHVITNTKLLEDVKDTLEKWEENDLGIVHKGTGHNKVNTGSGTYNDLHAQDQGRVIQTVHYNEYHQSDSAAAREQRTIEELLAWLNFPGMEQRREAVEPAHRNTFQWIFDDQRADAWEDTGSQHLSTSGSTKAKSTGFVTWLREETGVFWICGKPGAGKSTLMKYIMNDTRLKDHVSVWAGSHELSICSFYFWKHGSKTQKSTTGLYRAFLWQILNDDRTLARTAFPAWQTGFSTVEPGTDALRAALDRLIEACVLRKRWLILIDGLDEYEDDRHDALISQERLCQDVLRIVESGFVKAIVASRPDRAFGSHFSHGRNLAVHNLTARDIELFAHDRLIKDKQIRPSDESLTAIETTQLQYFVKAAVHKSQGVFLWTRIVVELARVHIRDYGEINQLEEIMIKLPPDLEELFDQVMHKILNLRKAEKMESLRYLALTSHWFAAFAGYESTSSHWLPISILGVGCELRSRNVTESWLEQNVQRLMRVGRNESRIEGRLKSCCFGLLETSSRGADFLVPPEPGPSRKVIRPLHRTLVEYLSSHPAIKSVQDLSLADHESFDANIAVLVGLVVMGDSDLSLIPQESHHILSVFQSVCVFNKLAEESTGTAQIGILSAFDRTMKEGFTALVRKYRRIEHDHHAKCASYSPGFYDLPNDVQCYVHNFEGLVLDFALNPCHPLISTTPRLEGFLDLLAITIVTGSNALLRVWANDTASIGSRHGAKCSAEHATRLLKCALSKQYVELEDFRAPLRNQSAEPNVEALQILIRLGGSVDRRFDGISEWERFLDDLLLRAVDMSMREDHQLLWGLKALHCLISHGVPENTLRTCPVMIEGQKQTPKGVSSRPVPHVEWRLIEFRNYSVVQIIRQITDRLRYESRLHSKAFIAEIAELEEMRHRLETQNGNSASRQTSSWPGLRESVKTCMRKRHKHWPGVDDALAVAHHKRYDIAKMHYLRLLSRWTGDDDMIVLWLPHGCRDMREFLNDLVPNAVKHPRRQFALSGEGQQAEFDVVGWLVKMVKDPKT